MNLPKQVLLIDDDEEELLILKAALNECCKDVELMQEKNGQAMLTRSINDSHIIPDIIFLDWNMPLISGSAMLSGLRKHPQYNTVPVVIFTGSIDPSYRAEAQALGASYFIYKPFSIADLSNKLKDLFSLDWRGFQSTGRLF
jgi:DNA-binding response OmpR family regulator